MRADFMIRGGRVMDPSAGTDEIRDVVIRNTKIVDAQGEAVECDHVIDASGCIVAPGLIDFHTHIFYEGSGSSIRPDLMIAQGTTAAVDAGSAGTATYEAFYKTVVAQSTVRIKSFLTTYSGGQLDFKLCEDFNPELINFDRLERVIDKYRDNILGLKIRLSKGVVPVDKGLEYLKRIVALAEELDQKLGTSLRVCVHTTNAPITAGELADCLRPGDIFCHCYQGMGNTIVTEDGGILPQVLEARKRGVIFDAANGRGNFGVETAKRALAAGFLPDIISSDLTIDKLNIPPYAKNLPAVMAKYITMGMALMDVLKAVTATPARIMGLEDKIGTLKPGADADLVILKETPKTFVQKDFRDEELVSTALFVPQLTMCAGEIDFCQADFFL